MGKFGWDLPPGCRASDIPGNRPEDKKWEAIINGFWDKKRTPEKDMILENASDNLIELIDEAIEYGIEVGTTQAWSATQENKYYISRWHEEVRNPKLRAFFKALRAKAQQV